MNDWQTVWHCLDARRVELGWTVSDLTAAIRLSETTLRKMRAGIPIVSPARIVRIERAVGWPVGTIQRILDTGEPPPECGPMPDMSRAATRQELNELWSAVTELALRVQALEIPPGSQG